MHLSFRITAAERAKIILILLTVVVTSICGHLRWQLAAVLMKLIPLTYNDTIDTWSESVPELGHSNRRREEGLHRDVPQTLH